MNREKLYLFVCFCVFNFLNGCFVACVGPLIPLFAAWTGHDETSYSYLFIVLTLANVLGCIVSKGVVAHYPLRWVFNSMTLSAMVGLLLLAASWSHFCLSVGFFIVNAALMVINITMTSCVFKLFLEDNPGFLMMIIGFVFGAGAIMGPAVVLLVEEHFFNIFSVMNMAILVALSFAVVPNYNSDGKEEVVVKVKLGRKTELCISALFCVYVVEELGLASWIPTYAIKMGVAETHTAGTYSFLFWVVNCLSRLIWMWFPISITKQIRISLILSISSTLVCLIFQSLGYYWLVCVFAPVSAGFILANMFSFCMSLPHDNGIESTPENTANFILGTTFGEGIFVTSIGYGMQYLGAQFLCVVEFFFAIVAFCIFLYTMQSFKEDKRNADKSLLGSELTAISH